MPLDPTYLLAGLGSLCVLLAALAMFLQHRLSLRQAELALLDERLTQATMAQEGLSAQLEAGRLVHADLSESRSALQAELAALRRETEWLQAQRMETRDALNDLEAERDAQQSELRALSAAHASVSAELNEQQKTHEQRLEDLQGARDELRAQFAELAGKIFEEREQRFAEASHERLGQLLDPLKERILSFEKRVEESYQSEAR